MLGPPWRQPQTGFRVTGVDAAFVRLVLLALPVSMLCATVRGQPFVGSSPLGISAAQRALS